LYESYFGLTERPFSIAPDPQYLYMSSRHKEAMAHLSYGLSQGGCFIVLTGEVGTGKTTLCRNLLGQLPDNVDIALILNANINEVELLQTICDERKIPYSQDATQKQLLDLINEYLLSTFSDNRHTVLIIDEAQLLSRDVLEQIRLLTNLETNTSKLLQIILIGQPELNDLLTRNDLRQLAQRVTARYHLGALQRNEIEEYVNYRLGVAGCKQALFSKQALHKLHTVTEGIPRKINVLADHALLAAYANSQVVVDAKMIKEASKEVFFDTSNQDGVISKIKQFAASNGVWSLAIVVVMLNVLLWWVFTNKPASGLDNLGGPKSSVNEIRTQAGSEERLSDDPEDELGIKQVETKSALVDGSLERVQGDALPTAAENTIGETPKEPQEKVDDLSPGVVVIADKELDATVDPELSIEGLSKSDSDQRLNTSIDEEIEGSAALYNSALSPSISSTLNSSDEYRDSELALLLEASADTTGRISAFRNLTELWGETLPDQLIQPACDVLLDKNLSCVGFGDWEQMMRFNRPAILVLNHENQLHRVIIGDVNQDLAEVAVGTTVRTVPVRELQARWNGNGVIFWRPDDGLAGSLSNERVFAQGASGESILALKLKLNQALERAGIAALESVLSPEFDLEMSQRAYALQTRFGIISDGRIGAETQMLMNELITGEQTPVLFERTR
jgi:general secretion pathway protein A